MEFSTVEAILKYCDDNNIKCDSQTALKFEKLSQMLCQFNEHTNVTALKSQEDIVNKHFIDSFSSLAFDLIKDNASVIDIGCGAGFPGLPIKIMRPDIKMSFVDSTAKKLKFTKLVCDEFGLDDVCLYPERAEELVSKGYREKYDVAISRAVATLPVLLELVVPFVKINGIFIAYKSVKETDLNDKNSELSLSKNAINKLGIKLADVYTAQICESNGQVRSHTLAVFKKIKQTPTNYPRRYAVILKKPL